MEGHITRVINSGLPQQDYERFERLLIYPQFQAWEFYYEISTFYKDSLILDYTSGFRYMTDYKNITPAGFSGTIAAQGQSTFSFYTSAGEELETHSLNGQSLNVTIPGAALIRITGDGQMIIVKANYDEILSGVPTPPLT